jgi:hypothetical protein
VWWVVVVVVVVVGSLLLFGTSLSLISKTEERGMHVRLALAVCGFLLWLLKLGVCMHAAATEKCPRAREWTAGAVRCEPLPAGDRKEMLRRNARQQMLLLFFTRSAL